jgi:hypothetical protein
LRAAYRAGRVLLRAPRPLERSCCADSGNLRGPRKVPSRSTRMWLRFWSNGTVRPITSPSACLPVEDTCRPIPLSFETRGVKPLLAWRVWSSRRTAPPVGAPPLRTLRWRMSTRLQMTASVVVMAGWGLAATFAPVEIAAVTGTAGSPAMVVVLQMVGALYLGFAMLNWMSRGSSLGGIYGRPIVVANTLHFTVASLALMKTLPGWHPPVVVAATMVCSVFAATFGLLLFRTPLPRQAQGQSDRR